MSIGDHIRAHVAPLARSMRLMLGRAVVKLVDDTKQMQELQLQLLADELGDGAEHFQPYGFTSNPQPGAEAIVGSIGGNRSHLVALVVDDRRYRLKNMAPGEVALYTDEGDYIWFKRGGDLEIKTAMKVVLTTPLVETSQDLHVKGSIACDHDVSDHNGSMQEMRDAYNPHVHGSSPGPDRQMT